MSISLLMITKNYYIATLFSEFTKSENIEIIHVQNYEQAKANIERKDLLAVVFDIPNPSINDFILWKELLKITSKPILILSSNIYEAPRILSRQQASIHLSKPFIQLF